MEDIIINKVAQSGLITLDLEKMYPKEEIVEFDLKDYLFMELILKEKDFREALAKMDFTTFKNKYVAIHCSTEAIIPLWAYMLATTYLQPYAKEVIYGTKENVFDQILLNNIKALDPNEYKEKRVVVKGCGDKKIPEAAYVTISSLLTPVAKSIMYGEPCSTVPIYKAIKKR